MGIVHVLKPGGEEQTWPASTLPERDALMELVEGHLEYVKVLYKGKPTYMVVNDVGALTGPGGTPPLPINWDATEIYHAATLKRAELGEDISCFGPRCDWPKIHGVAVVLENIHVP